MMTSTEALQNFWSSFGVPAYDENTVPDNAPLPRITYEVRISSLGYPVQITASIWARSKKWESVEDIAYAINQELSFGGSSLHFSGGIIWLSRGDTFIQRMSDPDKSIRRILLTLQAEYISEV